MKQSTIYEWLLTHVNSEADLKLNSRDIQPGDVFVACEGIHSHGIDFLDQAIAQGAKAVLIEARDDFIIDSSIPVLKVPDLKNVLGHLADQWYGYPSKTLNIIAITGTNGKTSCVNWVAQALNHGGQPCATIGTLGAIMPDGTQLGGYLTTPDVLTLHRFFAYLLKQEVYYVAMEASSIGIEQGRLDGIRLQIAAFTNLSHDHLDYHKNMQSYEEVKQRLFQWPGLKKAVYNLDDEVGERFFSASQVPTKIGYSYHNHPQAQVKAQGYAFNDYGLSFDLSTIKGEVQLLTRLVGEHNISNMLLVAAILESQGWGLKKIANAIAHLEPVPGRLDTVQAIKSAPHRLPLVVVDYSHTPAALEHVLNALRPNAEARQGKLICVFGCGGDRDRSKRPLMAKIAYQHADLCYVTSDNPRGEKPQAIIDEILSGASAITEHDPDRAFSILKAILKAQAEDVILLAGKGHEDYQETAGKRIHFDDKSWAQLALLMRQEVEVNTDSRTLSANQLFIALKGEHFDGHRFLSQAQEQQAVAAVVSDLSEELSLAQIQVADTEDALSVMARAWRSCFDLPVLAVTGSNGKTTTKEMIASILDVAYPNQYLATQGNLNNHIGVPLSVLALRKEHQIAVFELGMNHPGEIMHLASIAQPTVALVNNAQREHQEFMHSVKAVALENGAVFKALSKSGVAVFPAQDNYSELWQEMAANHKVQSFALQAPADVWAEQLETKKLGLFFQITTQKEQAKVQLQLCGLHNVHNALAAASTCLSAGLPLQQVVTGLEQFTPVKGRLQSHQINNQTIIDDSYNANPDSVRAAIDVLAALNKPQTLVLGDMAEVGVEGPEVHEEVARYAHEQGIDYLFLMGQATQHCVKPFGTHAYHFESLDTLLAKLKNMPVQSILVKGSRSMQMERVVQALLAAEQKEA